MRIARIETPTRRSHGRVGRIDTFAAAKAAVRTGVQLGTHRRQARTNESGAVAAISSYRQRLPIVGANVIGSQAHYARGRVASDGHTGGLVGPTKVAVFIKGVDAATAGADAFVVIKDRVGNVVVGTFETKLQVGDGTIVRADKGHGRQRGIGKVGAFIG